MSDLKITIIEKFAPFLEPYRFKVAHGGRGCVHPDTLIDTPDGQVPIRDFGGGMVYSWKDGKRIKTLATRPKEYSVESLYEVVLDSGQSIVATDEHKFLTNNGWKMLKDLSSSDLICIESDRTFLSEKTPPLTNSACAPLRFRRDALHWKRTALGFLVDCSLHPRQYGQQPLPRQGGAQSSTPLQGDGLPHSRHALTLSGVQGPFCTDIPYSTLFHASNRVSPPFLEGQCCVGRENCTFERSSEQPLGSFLSSLQSPYCTALEKLNRLLEALPSGSCFLKGLGENLQKLFCKSSLFGYDRTVSDRSLETPLYQDGDFDYTGVRLIRNHGRQRYWDLHVPETNNYLSNGIVNHNSGKSWTIAQLLLIRAYREPTRILCAREIQKSITDSVIQLLDDQVDRMGLRQFFDVQRNAIYGKNGSKFIFEGLRSNITKIKSMEGIDIVWVEEAEAVSRESWDVLIPTIRKPGSEIWVSFNPMDELDDTYQRFVESPSEDSYEIQVNWQDNPWFPDVLRIEKDRMAERNEDLYKHIWEGEPLRNREGAYYSKYIRDEQVTRVPIEHTLPVNTYWDLGISDSTAIWFVQTVGQELRVINYLEDHGEGLPYYIQKLKDFQDEYSFSYGEHWAPHDINVRELTTGKSRLESARHHGINFLQVPQVPVQDGIHAARSILPRCFFDKEACRDGIRALRNYRRDYDEKKSVFKNTPRHDWASHGSDAFRYFAIAHREKAHQYSKPIKANGSFNVYGR